MQTKKVFNKYGDSIKFIAIFIFLFLAYKALFFSIWRSEYLFMIYYDFSIWWINCLLVCSEFLLGLFDYEVEVIEVTRIVKIEGTSGVTVGEPCIGFDIMALFIGLIISTNYFLSKKIYYVSLALIIINSLNVLRISALAVLVQFDPYLWELNHKFIFTIIIYLTMFLFWRVSLRPMPNVAQ